MVLTAAAGRSLRGRRGQPQHGRSAARGGVPVSRQRTGRRYSALLGQRFRKPPRPADAALLLPFRRPVLSDVSAKGDRPRTPGCTAAQLVRRVCSSIPACPLFPYAFAPATPRLVHAAEIAR